MKSKLLIIIFFLLGSLLNSFAVLAASLPNYELNITDGVFNPTQIEVPAEQRFKITIKNTGTSPVEFENLAMRVEKVLGPGVTSFVVIHPLKAGSYQFIDEFHMDLSPFTIIAK